MDALQFLDQPTGAKRQPVYALSGDEAKARAVSTNWADLYKIALVKKV